MLQQTVSYKTSRPKMLENYTDFFESPTVIGAMIDAHPEDVEFVINKDTVGYDGRSEWVWLRLINGDLVLACFPQGVTYLEISDKEGMV